MAFFTNEVNAALVGALVGAIGASFADALRPAWHTSRG